MVTTTNVRREARVPSEGGMTIETPGGTRTETVSARETETDTEAAGETEAGAATEPLRDGSEALQETDTERAGVQLTERNARNARPVPTERIAR